MEIECKSDHALNAPIAGKFRKGDKVTVSETIGNMLAKDKRWKKVGTSDDKKIVVKEEEVNEDGGSSTHGKN